MQACRTQEFMHLLKAFWREAPRRGRVTFAGEYYTFDLTAELPPPMQPGGPLLYFGGASPEAKEGLFLYEQGWIDAHRG